MGEEEGGRGGKRPDLAERGVNGYTTSRNEFTVSYTFTPWCYSTSYLQAFFTRAHTT